MSQTPAHPADEKRRFSAIDVAGEHIPGHFALGRATGSLAYAPCLFVVEHGGAGRLWPIQAVTCLYPAD